MILLAVIVVILIAVSIFLYVENINRKREIDGINESLVDMMTKYIQIWKEVNKN